MSETADSRPQVEEAGSRYGFVHYVDNPLLVRAMVNNLMEFGLSRECIEVKEDFRTFMETLKSGDTVVVNSLFDIAADVMALIPTVCELISGGIVLISLEDKGMEVSADDTCAEDLLKMLDNFVKMSGKDKTLRTESQLEGPQIKPTYRTSRDERFWKAYEIWSRGRTIAYAAREAGCSYNSFRYWLMKINKLQDSNSTK